MALKNYHLLKQLKIWQESNLNEAWYKIKNFPKPNHSCDTIKNGTTYNLDSALVMDKE